MKFRPYIALVALVSAVELPAQGSSILMADSVATIVSDINASGNIIVVQPEALSLMLLKHGETQENETDMQQDSRATTSRPGYRIQVFDDNNPRTAAAQAKARGYQMESSFPQYKTYVSFNSPYWRVKVGDFRTRGEAEAAMADIRDVFPQLGAYLRIVRDKINIFD